MNAHFNGSNIGLFIYDFKVERTRLTFAKTEDVPRKLVRDLKLRDATGDVRITLWEGTALYCSVHPGDHIIVSDASVSYNNHYTTKVLNVQFPDMVLVSSTSISLARKIVKGKQ